MIGVFIHEPIVVCTQNNYYDDPIFSFTLYRLTLWNTQLFLVCLQQRLRSIDNRTKQRMFFLIKLVKLRELDVSENVYFI